MIVSHFPGGGSVGNKPIYEEIMYSGSMAYVDDGGDNWRIKFLTSGEFTLKKAMTVDIFAVGGGGNGADWNRRESGEAGGGGGGGGYTNTIMSRELEAGKTYVVTIGAANGTSSLVEKGGETICEAAGGKSASAQNGGNGGSGGGPAGWGAKVSQPASDGNSASDITTSTTVRCKGGIGQGTTTREFGEDTGDLYAGGGAGAMLYALGVGGEGGGGNAAYDSTHATNGGENTGGGGGGTYNSMGTPGQGGSGIVIIRNHRVSIT